MMPKKKPYFPNNWKMIKDSPPKWFGTLDYDEFMDWKIAGWEIPSSVAAIIREQDLESGKVKEYVYSTIAGANKRALKIMKNSKSEFTVATHDDLAHMYPQGTIKNDHPNITDPREWFDDKLDEEYES